jgi:hypothetical protein
VDGIADRLRADRAVDEEVGDPALAEAETEPAAQFDPALIADGRRDQSVAGDGGDDAGMIVGWLVTPRSDCVQMTGRENFARSHSFGLTKSFGVRRRFSREY